jgi:hypothetical protein
MGSAVKPIAVNNRPAAGARPEEAAEFLKQWQAALGRK